MWFKAMFNHILRFRLAGVIEHSTWSLTLYSIPKTGCIFDYTHTIIHVFVKVEDGYKSSSNIIDPRLNMRMRYL